MRYTFTGLFCKLVTMCALARVADSISNYSTVLRANSNNDTDVLCTTRRYHRDDFSASEVCLTPVPQNSKEESSQCRDSGLRGVNDTFYDSVPLERCFLCSDITWFRDSRGFETEDEWEYYTDRGPPICWSATDKVTENDILSSSPSNPRLTLHRINNDKHSRLVRSLKWLTTHEADPLQKSFHGKPRRRVSSSGRNRKKSKRKWNRRSGNERDLNVLLKKTVLLPRLLPNSNVNVYVKKYQESSSVSSWTSILKNRMMHRIRKRATVPVEKEAQAYLNVLNLLSGTTTPRIESQLTFNTEYLNEIESPATTIGWVSETPSTEYLSPETPRRSETSVTPASTKAFEKESTTATPTTETSIETEEEAEFYSSTIPLPVSTTTEISPLRTNFPTQLTVSYEVSKVGFWETSPVITEGFFRTIGTTETPGIGILLTEITESLSTTASSQIPKMPAGFSDIMLTTPEVMNETSLTESLRTSSTKREEEETKEEVYESTETFHAEDYEDYYEEEEEEDEAEGTSEATWYEYEDGLTVTAGRKYSTESAKSSLTTEYSAEGTDFVTEISASSTIYPEGTKIEVTVPASLVGILLSTTLQPEVKSQTMSEGATSFPVNYVTGEQSEITRTDTSFTVSEIERIVTTKAWEASDSEKQTSEGTSKPLNKTTTVSTSRTANFTERIEVSTQETIEMTELSTSRRSTEVGETTNLEKLESFTDLFTVPTVTSYVTTRTELVSSIRFFSTIESIPTTETTIGESTFVKGTFTTSQMSEVTSVTTDLLKAESITGASATGTTSTLTDTIFTLPVSFSEEGKVESETTWTESITTEMEKGSETTLSTGMKIITSMTTESEEAESITAPTSTTITSTPFETSELTVSPTGKKTENETVSTKFATTEIKEKIEVELKTTIEILPSATSEVAQTELTTTAPEVITTVSEISERTASPFTEELSVSTATKVLMSTTPELTKTEFIILTTAMEAVSSSSEIPFLLITTPMQEETESEITSGKLVITETEEKIEVPLTTTEKIFRSTTETVETESTTVTSIIEPSFVLNLTSTTETGTESEAESSATETSKVFTSTTIEIQKSELPTTTSTVEVSSASTESSFKSPLMEKSTESETTSEELVTTSITGSTTVKITTGIASLTTQLKETEWQTSQTVIRLITETTPTVEITKSSSETSTATSPQESTANRTTESESITTETVTSPVPIKSWTTKLTVETEKSTIPDEMSKPLTFEGTVEVSSTVETLFTSTEVPSSLSETVSITGETSIGKTSEGTFIFQITEPKVNFTTDTTTLSTRPEVITTEPKETSFSGTTKESTVSKKLTSTEESTVSISTGSEFTSAASLPETITEQTEAESASYSGSETANGSTLPTAVTGYKELITDLSSTRETTTELFTQTSTEGSSLLSTLAAEKNFSTQATTASLYKESRTELTSTKEASTAERTTEESMLSASGELSSTPFYSSTVSGTSEPVTASSLRGFPATTSTREPLSGSTIAFIPGEGIPMERTELRENATKGFASAGTEAYVSESISMISESEKTEVVTSPATKRDTTAWITVPMDTQEYVDFTSSTSAMTSTVIATLEETTSGTRPGELTERIIQSSESESRSSTGEEKVSLETTVTSESTTEKTMRTETGGISTATESEESIDYFYDQEYGQEHKEAYEEEYEEGTTDFKTIIWYDYEESATTKGITEPRPEETITRPETDLDTEKYLYITTRGTTEFLTTLGEILLTTVAIERYTEPTTSAEVYTSFSGESVSSVVTTEEWIVSPVQEISPHTETFGSIGEASSVISEYTSPVTVPPQITSPGPYESLSGLIASEISAWLTTLETTEFESLATTVTAPYTVFGRTGSETATDGTSSFYTGTFTTITGLLLTATGETEIVTASVSSERTVHEKLTGSTVLVSQTIMSPLITSETYATIATSLPYTTEYSSVDTASTLPFSPGCTMSMFTTETLVLSSPLSVVTTSESPAEAGVKTTEEEISQTEGTTVSTEEYYDVEYQTDREEEYEEYEGTGEELFEYEEEETESTETERSESTSRFPAGPSTEPEAASTSSSHWTNLTTEFPEIVSSTTASFSVSDLTSPMTVSESPIPRNETSSVSSVESFDEVSSTETSTFGASVRYPETSAKGTLVIGTEEFHTATVALTEHTTVRSEEMKSELSEHRRDELLRELERMQDAEEDISRKEKEQTRREEEWQIEKERLLAEIERRQKTESMYKTESTDDINHDSSSSRLSSDYRTFPDSNHDLSSPTDEFILSMSTESTTDAARSELAAEIRNLEDKLSKEEKRLDERENQLLERQKQLEKEKQEFQTRYRGDLSQETTQTETTDRESAPTKESADLRGETEKERTGNESTMLLRTTPLFSAVPPTEMTTLDIREATEAGTTHHEHETRSTVVGTTGSKELNNETQATSSRLEESTWKGFTGRVCLNVLRNESLGKQIQNLVTEKVCLPQAVVDLNEGSVRAGKSNGNNGAGLNGESFKIDRLELGEHEWQERTSSSRTTGITQETDAYSVEEEDEEERKRRRRENAKNWARNKRDTSEWLIESSTMTDVYPTITETAWYTMEQESIDQETDYVSIDDASYEDHSFQAGIDEDSDERTSVGDLEVETDRANTDYTKSETTPVIGVGKRISPGQEWPTEAITAYHIGGTRTWSLEIPGEKPSDEMESEDEAGKSHESQTETTCVYVVLENREIKGY